MYLKFYLEAKIVKAKQEGFIIMAENGYGFFSMTEDNRELVLNEKEE